MQDTAEINHALITHAFISYAHRDTIIADEIERQLTVLAGKGRGSSFLKCFLDTKSIPPGQLYQPIIKSALEQADWLIVVFTGDQTIAATKSASTAW